MSSNPNYRIGLWFSLVSNLIWGFLPLYFQLVRHVPATEAVAHRILWSLAFLAVILSILRGGWRSARDAAVNRRVQLILSASAVLMGLNWLSYLWAVLNGQVLASSLGYYLSLLVNVLLGVVLLRERLTRPQLAAVLLAAAGVSVLAFGAGSAIWISLILAVTGGLYGMLRKVAPVESLQGLAIETAILAPFAAAWLVWRAVEGASSSLADAQTLVLLIVGGVISTLPMLLFVSAARRLPYSTLGILQYLTPSLQFLVAVVFLGERLTMEHLLCFGAIWAALAIFTVDSFASMRRSRAEQAARSGSAQDAPFRQG